MKNIPIVCYLYTYFDSLQSLKNFKNNYLNYNAGLEHELLICFKLIKQDEIKIITNKLEGLKYIQFIDPVQKNDFDFGSYKRVSEKYSLRDILFLNGHSYPVSENWLKKLMKYKRENTLIGTSASYESIANSIKLKKKYKFISYFLKLYRFKKNFFKFPNPHIRTSSFLIKGKLFLDFIKNKKINNKEDAWKIESGKESLTNYFKKKNYDIFVVNSDGKKYFENEWKLSETYNYRNQSKSIISDKHTRKYLSLTEDEKLLYQLKNWGP